MIHTYGKNGRILCTTLKLERFYGQARTVLSNDDYEDLEMSRLKKYSTIRRKINHFAVPSSFEHWGQIYTLEDT